MKLYHSLSDLEKKDSDSCRRSVTIGNFDGCHLGHQQLIGKAIDQAKRLGLKTMAFTFEPHPRVFFQKVTENRLYTLEQKIRLLGEFGLDELYVQHFDEAFSRLSHEDFFEDILLRKLRSRVLVIGEDFQFGFGRRGNVEYLRHASEKIQLELCVEQPTTFKGDVISSTRIREAILAGKVEEACQMLGRPYVLEGEVIKGRQLGRTLGVPTANIQVKAQRLPLSGVYLGKVSVWDSVERPKALSQEDLLSLPALVNVGTKPTIEQSNTMSIEVHILNAQIALGELYGKTLSFYFEKRLRDEKKFSGLEELKAQIQSDISDARRYFHLS